ncbi:histidine-rich glycoprotein [Bactrocera neohumeralis]|uniref:histidine-rich glycoprotein n=1 Tax=Bactrocera neohumeralis TaxID=98809 RepID=UPI00216583B6|nr:histidine-rich glycoprotein [Bactrocera neohumeralis]
MESVSTHMPLCPRTATFRHDRAVAEKWPVICLLALAFATANAGLLPHHGHDTHIVEGAHHVDIPHGSGIHLGHSSAIVIDAGGAAEHIESHPVYHHDEHSAHVDVHPIVHDSHLHHDVHHDVHHDIHHTAAAAKIVHHEPIHHVEPVHHVTKVVHHEPHHFLHYVKPVIDHHVIHQDNHHDEHFHAHDLHHAEAYHGPLLHHHEHVAHHAHLVDHHHHHAALVHHVPAHTHSAVVHKIYPGDAHHGSILAFARHALHGKYGKVKITEKLY